MRRSDRVLIIVQNLPVPFDRRVWMECRALTKAGFGVSVICPKGPGDPWHHVVEGVRIYKYPGAPRARGAAGFAFEFVYCWIWTALLSVVVGIRDGFGAMQVCNPPDTYFLLGRLWGLLGKRFVFDQHDLNPELYLSRFGTPTGVLGRLQLRFLYAIEAGTYRTADHVISTNESYRAVAIERGGVDAASATVVRSGPDTDTMRPIELTAPPIVHDSRYLAVYLGIMGPQDGVDVTIRALDVIVHRHGRTDCHLALLGFGDCLDELKQLSRDLDLSDHVTFTGRVGRDEIAAHLSSADIGLGPDRRNVLNDVSTMNKTMEYMAYGLPVVTSDLVETRVSAGEAGVYVEPGDVDAFAAAWLEVLDDHVRRRELSMLARRRVTTELDWAPQAERYVSVWEKVLGTTRPVPTTGGPSWPGVDRRRVQVRATDHLGRPYVDLRGTAPATEVVPLHPAAHRTAPALIDLVALEQAQPPTALPTHVDLVALERFQAAATVSALADRVALSDVGPGEPPVQLPGAQRAETQLPTQPAAQPAQSQAGTTP